MADATTFCFCLWELFDFYVNQNSGACPAASAVLHHVSRQFALARLFVSLDYPCAERETARSHSTDHMDMWHTGDSVIASTTYVSLWTEWVLSLRSVSLFYQKSHALIVQNHFCSFEYSWSLITKRKSYLISDIHTVFKLRACLILDAIWINTPFTDDCI